MVGLKFSGYLINEGMGVLTNEGVKNVIMYL